jgi:zinc transport system substrate-binding protein
MRARRGVVLVVTGSITLLASPLLAPTAGAARHRVEVVASFFPLAEAAKQIGGADVTVRNLTPPGAEPHDLELTPDDRDALEDADLVIALGGGFQPAIEDAVDQRDGASLVLVDNLPAKDRAHAKTDPHLWLDPVQMRRIATQVARALTKADPKAADGIARRAAAFDVELGSLDTDYRTGLSHCERDLVVTSHAAFGWLARRYGLRQEGVAGIDPESEPGPDRIADLADLVARTGTTTVFTEDLVSPKVADALAREAGVKTETLSPLEGLTDAQRAHGATYVSVMRANLRKLRTALGCS